MRAVSGVAVSAVVVGLLAFAVPAGAQSLFWSYPGGIAVPPDNRHVYVTSNDGTLALARDPGTGALSQVSQHIGAGGALEIAPDGRSVYVGRERPNGQATLIAFARDAGTGALRTVPVSGWPVQHPVNDIAVSPDGATVYATDASRNELAIFARAPSDGSLSHVGSAPATPGVYNLSAMAISPDGRWLYAEGRSSPEGWGGEIVRFERLPGGGLAVAQVVHCGCGGDTVALSPAGWLYVGPFGPTAWRWDQQTGGIGEAGHGFVIWSSGGGPGGSNLAVSQNGVAYAANSWANSVVQIRPTADGYEAVRAYREGDDGARGIQDLRSLAIAPDGAHVYVAAGSNSVARRATVATFARDPAAGDLRFVSLFTGGGLWPPLTVTINGGAEYTDDRDVVVGVRGGVPFTHNVELGNDRGFGDGRVFEDFRPGGSRAWRLASTGPGGLMKTLYARPAFQEWRGDAARDSIVLDETRPVVVAARRVPGRAGRLRVRARDRVSGVRRVQIASRRSRPGPWRRYRAGKLYPVGRAAAYVRALDRAGNRSRWRRVPRG